MAGVADLVEFSKMVQALGVNFRDGRNVFEDGIDVEDLEIGIGGGAG